jgi:hypothetical protein
MKSKDQKVSKTSGKDRERNDALNRNARDEKDKLPGEYPPQEDIMNRQNMKRVGLDVENFSRTIGAENYTMPGEPIVTDPNDILEEPSIAIENEATPTINEWPAVKDLNADEHGIGEEQNDSDVTEEDLIALGPKDLSMDMGEDEQLLKNRVWPVDMAGQDLDIPGSENAGHGEDEASGPEDEENDFYSLGGDRHEDQLEGK